MASSMVSSASIASINHASPAQASMVAPFTGLKSSSGFPVTRQLNKDIISIASNGGRVQCMQPREEEAMAMASSMVSSASVDSVSQATPAQASMVAPFTGLKSASAFPVTRQLNSDITSTASNGGRVQCMQVWPPVGEKKFETLSYLPPLSPESLSKEVDYLLRMGWVPCLEFELEHGFVYREHNKSPGYYDGRYWKMWKLPMFGCTDSAQVLSELEEAKKAYPNSIIRIIGFNNKRQVQCISFIAYKPPSF
ncbi:hypothetical protein EZV62_018714 [Acer yangbiense]|uniref:Ribulose bisphosphate carboxylase small subunit, chloroplastic n=1 Tax=Acer yangbiense TaxID=1000413 RepID=A0A5C7HKA1_9ROSI|nr:hypothetical protein EZV62_018714 [Acer yangbiense]